MNVADVVVLLAAVIAVAGLGWFFFGPRKASTAAMADGVQRVQVWVAGGFSGRESRGPSPRRCGWAAGWSPGRSMRPSA